MSIFNQSITPNRQPAFPSSQDASQHIPAALPSHGSSNSFKSIQLSPFQKTPLMIANGGGSSHRESLPTDMNLLLGVKNQGQNSTVEPVDEICNLSHPLDGKDHFGLLDQAAAPAEVTEQNKSKIRGAGGDAEFEPCTLSFLRSLLENEKFNLIKDVMGELDIFSSGPNVTLLVSVSSAVKLERRQIDQIAKKMQRLTGFRNLRLENTVDPSLIAGFVISYGTDEVHVIDLSVKGQLAVLAARIESSDQRIANHSQSWSFPSP